MSGKKIAVVYDRDLGRYKNNILPLLENSGYEVRHFTGSAVGQEFEDICNLITNKTHPDNKPHIDLLLTASQTYDGGYDVAQLAGRENIPVVMYTQTSDNCGRWDVLSQANKNAGFYEYDPHEGMNTAVLEGKIREAIARVAEWPQKPKAIDPAEVQATRPKQWGKAE